MKLPLLTTSVERDEDWFIAICPELGVTSQGHSPAEAESMLQEAVKLLLETADTAEIEKRLARGVTAP